MIMHLDEADVRSVLSWDELIVVMEKSARRLFNRTRATTRA